MEWMRNAIDRLVDLRVLTDVSEFELSIRLARLMDTLSAKVPSRQLRDGLTAQLDEVRRSVWATRNAVNDQVNAEIARLSIALEPVDRTEPIYAAPSGHPYATRQAVIEPRMTDPATALRAPKSRHDPITDPEQFLWGHLTDHVPLPRESAGGDHALAAVLGAIARHDPGALRRMVDWDPNSTDGWEKGAPLLRFPGRRPFRTSPLLLHVQNAAAVAADQSALWPAPPSRWGMRPAGIVAGTVSDEAPGLGISYLAKGYAACLSRQEHPFYLPPDETPLAARVQEAMSFLTGRPTTWENPRLELDDDALTHRLNATEVVACSRSLGPDEAYALGVYSGQHAYTVVDAHQGHVWVNHPRGQRFSLSVADFRDVFPDMICGTTIGPGGPGPTPTAAQLDNLAAHLDG